MRLTGHARGDLKSLWATVPGEAVLVEVDKTGAPVAATEQVIPARDVSVGAHVFVRSGKQVSRFLPLFFFFACRRFSAAATKSPLRSVSRRKKKTKKKRVSPTPMTILSQKPPRGG